MKRYGVWLVVGLVAGLLLVGGLALIRPYTYNGSLYDPAVPAADFTLQRAAGGPYHLAEQRGKAVVMFFGYTYCPDVCPATLAEMRDVLKQLKGKEDRVDFLFVTVDPERDTPERLVNYTAAFDERIQGLTGSEAELEPVYAAYGVYRAKQEVESAAGYLVDHTSLVYVIDPSGGLRLTYPFGSDPNAIAEDLRQVLKADR
jgi:protein SCO1/2